MALTENRKQILEWASDPQTVGMMANFWQGSKSALYRDVDFLVEAKMLYEVGFYKDSKKKPERVISSWQVKSDNIEHEIGLTKMVQALGVRGLRGPEVRQDIRPDMSIGKLHVEWDRGTKDHQRLQIQLWQYEDLEEDSVVVVVPSKARKKRILSDCGFLTDGLLVGTVEEVMKPLKDVVLTCCDGTKHRLEKVWKRLGISPTGKEV